MRNPKDLYIKANFEVSVFCKSRHDSKDTNMLSRLRSTIARAINDKIRLPKYILLVLDDDLVDHLGVPIHKLLGTWIEWLANTFKEMFTNRKEVLPNKAIKKGYPLLYWVAPPHHKNFDNNRDRTVLTTCMETVFKVFDEIRIIRMKEIWDYEDDDLINLKGRFTTLGLDRYWQSIDASIKFNIQKRERYLAKNNVINTGKADNKRPADKEDPMKTFFKKKSKTSTKSGRKLPSPKDYFI